VSELKFPISTKVSTLLPNKIVTALNVHSSNGEYSKNMFSEQFAYGHREILLKYCNLDYTAQIIGNVQHGVYYPDEKIDFRTPRFIGGRPSKFWVFSEETAIKSRALGYKHVQAIGAPWLYMKNALDQIERPSTKLPSRVLIMPSHSQVSYWSRNGKVEKQKQAARFREATGSLDATVCLHAVDFCDPETRNAFLEMNFEVICLGSSQSTIPWTQSSNRVRILFDLMSLMKEFSHFLTDDFGTPLIYAINMGMEIGIYPEISLEMNYQLANSESTFTNPNLVEYFSENMSTSFNQFGPAAGLEIMANEVLGVSALKAPEELREILDYRLGIYPKYSVEPW
jgi:hypothetical protein